MEKEAKKEGFRKYLESSGAIDALTKVLVSLYEQNDKPSSSIEFIQQKLGGPTMTDYEKIQAEMSDLQIRYNELLTAHQEKCRELEELRKSHSVASYEDVTASTNDPQEEKHELLYQQRMETCISRFTILHKSQLSMLEKFVRIMTQWTKSRITTASRRRRLQPRNHFNDKLGEDGSSGSSFWRP